MTNHLKKGVFFSLPITLPETNGSQLTFLAGHQNESSFPTIRFQVRLHGVFSLTPYGRGGGVLLDSPLVENLVDFLLGSGIVQLQGNECLGRQRALGA